MEILNSVFKVLIELFIFDKQKRAKIKARWAKKYLKKYANLAVKEISNDVNLQNTDKKEEIIWQYWHQDKKNAPELIKKCFESVQKYENDKKINVISFDTINNFVELPSKYYDLLNKGKISIAIFSDILRLYLLEQYGGCWVDSTILLTDKIPQSVWNSIFCVPQKNPKIDNQENRMSCFFMRAKKESKNLKAIKIAIENYWSENDFLINYFMFEHISTLISDKTDELKFEWDNMPYIAASDCSVMQAVMDKNLAKEEFEKIKSKSFMHKLTYKKKFTRDFLDNI